MAVVGDGGGVLDGNGVCLTSKDLGVVDGLGELLGLGEGELPGLVQ